VVIFKSQETIRLISFCGMAVSNYLSSPIQTSSFVVVVADDDDDDACSFANCCMGLSLWFPDVARGIRKGGGHGVLPAMAA